MSLVFLDTETTGLDPHRHEVWEIAYAVDDGPIRSGVLWHSLRHADPTALAMNGYWERTKEVDTEVCAVRETGARAALDGATLVGANPAFDAAFLRARWGCTPWHHRLWDVEAYAAGVLALDKVPGLATIASMLRDLGHEIPEPDHSAAGDVATLRACFRALQNIAGERVGLTNAERRDAVRRLHAQGLGDREIADRIGSNRRQVRRDRGRFGLPSNIPANQRKKWHREHKAEVSATRQETQS